MNPLIPQDMQDAEAKYGMIFKAFFKIWSVNFEIDAINLNFHD